MLGVLTEMRNALDDSKLVISIVAGVTLSALADQLGTTRLARVMPNTPALVGECAAGFALGKGAKAEDGPLVEQLFRGVGRAFQLEERLLDAVTGLSGSGPAYVFLMIDFRDPDRPIIHVRSWQPEAYTPRSDVLSLGDFEIIR